MLIAITGGIGAGKSVISRSLTVMGYEVYDCDSRAKEIIDNSEEIKSEISRRISSAVIDKDCRLDRRALASIVFSDKNKLKILNDITHGAVRQDIAEWTNKVRESGKVMFVETAILYESGIDKMVDCVWEVTAPYEIRIGRVMSRDKTERGSVEKRIAMQSQQPVEPHQDVHIIINDGCQSVIGRLIGLLNNIEKITLK